MKSTITACFHVFTGSRNSARTVEIIQKRLASEGCLTCYQSVARDTIPPYERFDLHIFTFPVYAFDVPDIMIRYMKRLPKGNCTYAAAIAIKGKIHKTQKPPRTAGMKGGAVERARRILTEKKYIVLISSAVSFYSARISGQHSAAPGEMPDTIRLAEEKINSIADSLIHQINLKNGTVNS